MIHFYQKEGEEFYSVVNYKAPIHAILEKQLISV